MGASLSNFSVVVAFSSNTIFEMQRNRMVGALDEVRLASAARSSNWVWAAWMNQASNTVFATYGESILRGTIVIIR